MRDRQAGLLPVGGGHRGDCRGIAQTKAHRQGEYGPLGSCTARPQGDNGREVGDEDREKGAPPCEPHQEV